MVKSTPSNAKKKPAFLILNLGTPADPSPKSVKNYLAEFLMDGDVISLPWVLRWILVRVILLIRPKKSAVKYSKIWTSAGSPLLVNHLELVKRVEVAVKEQGVQTYVFPAMRYGEPSLEAAFKKACLNNPQEIYLLPLYPQFALATSGSSEKLLVKLSKKYSYSNPIYSLKPFSSHPSFSHLWRVKIQEHLKDKIGDFHLVFSFHGIPEKALRTQKLVMAVDEHCGANSECKNCTQDFEQYNPGEGQSFCYFRQCVAGAKQLASSLSLRPGQYSVAFQSRVGAAKWLRPYFEEHLKQLILEKSVKNVCVVPLSFVADCLETLEELSLQGSEVFKEHGGQNYTVVPALNYDEPWVKRVAEWVCSVQTEGRDSSFRPILNEIKVKN